MNQEEAVQVKLKTRRKSPRIARKGDFKSDLSGELAVVPQALLAAGLC